MKIFVQLKEGGFEFLGVSKGDVEFSLRLRGLVLNSGR